ncbi:MAG: ScpA family protein [Planctomycetota bacterium]
MEFRVAIDAYHGPLDLLLHLVRKEELPIAELPLAQVAEQYLEHVAVLERLDPDGVGEFLDVATALLEIKSRAVLPSAEEAAAEDVEPTHAESSADLVERLLEFKRYRDAADELQTLRLDWSRRRTRSVATERASAERPSERPVEGLELWDLVSAFARVMRDRLAPEPEAHAVVFDDTPIRVHMRRVADRLEAAAGPVAFAELFPAEPVHRSTLVGVFQALLELVRYRHAVASQPRPFGPIEVALGGAPLLDPGAAAPSPGAGSDTPPA